jgi:hypothetical protein
VEFFIDLFELIPEHFHVPKRSPMSICSHFLIPLSLATTDLLSVSTNLPVLDICINRITHYRPSHLSSFTYCSKPILLADYSTQFWPSTVKEIITFLNEKKFQWIWRSSQSVPCYLQLCLNLRICWVVPCP